MRDCTETQTTAPPTVGADAATQWKATQVKDPKHQCDVVLRLQPLNPYPKDLPLLVGVGHTLFKARFFWYSLVLLQSGFGGGDFRLPVPSPDPACGLLRWCSFRQSNQTEWVWYLHRDKGNIMSWLLQRLAKNFPDCGTFNGLHFQFCFFLIHKYYWLFVCVCV